MDNNRIIMRVSLISIIGNVLLSLIKFIVGLVGHSSALISDSIHSLSDVLSTFVVIIGVKISGKKPDDDHPYGHERLECVGAIILAIMLLVTGLGIGRSALYNIINKTDVVIPSILTIYAAIFSILLKEWMFQITKKASIKVNSSALLADAWHHRSDALSSIGSLIGVVGSRMGYPIFDSIASIIICLFILKVSVDIFKDAIDKMVDKSCDKNIIDSINNIINTYDDIRRVDDLRTRIFGNKFFIDIEIALDKDMSLYAAHKVAEDLHDEIEKQIPNVKHCMIHVNPFIKSKK